MGGVCDVLRWGVWGSGEEELGLLPGQGLEDVVSLGQVVRVLVKAVDVGRRRLVLVSSKKAAAAAAAAAAAGEEGVGGQQQQGGGWGVGHVVEEGGGEEGTSEAEG